MHFPLNVEKKLKKQNFRGNKYKLVLYPFTGLEVHWNSTTIYSRLRVPLAQPYKKIGEI